LSLEKNRPNEQYITVAAPFGSSQTGVRVIHSDIRAKVKKAYGRRDGNWGDLPIFQGDYINFGYWAAISQRIKFTREDRIKSSAALYKYVIDALRISKNDTVLELGCGRAVGMLDTIEYIDLKTLIGVDITPAQIWRAKRKKTIRETNHLQENLSTKKLVQDLDNLESQVELYSRNNKAQKEELEQELEALNQQILEQENKPNIRIETRIELLTANLQRATNFELYKKDERKELQEKKHAYIQNMETKKKIVEKIQSIKLYAKPAESTELKAHSVDKIYSVEVFQHIEDFNPLAVEINRILVPGGKLSFCAHLATNYSSYDKLREENLLLDEIEVLRPIDEVIGTFNHNGFDVNCHTIGEHVFGSYDKYVTEANPFDELSRKIYNSYNSGYIDYYVCVMEKVKATGNTFHEHEEHDEL
jgi:cyclopropane fatty-acyl-phospholipid synthase-like methyltransferase